MKCSFTGLISLVLLFMTALSAPVERGDAVLYHPSSHRGHLSLHRGLSHRIRKALVKQPLNLTFTPIDSIHDFVHVEYSSLTQLQASDSLLSTTLVEVGRDDGIVDAGPFSGSDTQTTLRSPDVYGGRHVMVSISDTLAWALQQKGVSKDNMPQYVRQNVQVTDPSTGNHYLLVPAEQPPTIDSNAIMITLKMN